jgi:hypothetical protein
MYSGSFIGINHVMAHFTQIWFRNKAKLKIAEFPKEGEVKQLHVSGFALGWRCHTRERREKEIEGLLLIVINPVWPADAVNAERSMIWVWQRLKKADLVKHF